MIKIGGAGAMEPFNFKAWAVSDALPFWSRYGVDKEKGGFFERLHCDGSPDRNAIRRLRVQARQIYVYSHAAYLGWYSDGIRTALDGFSYMMDKAYSPDGAPGFVHLLTADGAVENPLRDTYDHMFVLLSLAWLARVTGDSQIRRIIAEVMQFIDENLTDRHGTLLEGMPASLPRRQNPNMHAFETMLALHETLEWPDAIGRAQRIFALFQSHFIDPATGALREYFADDWSPLPAPLGDVVEPGHHVEWTWLLRRYQSLGGQIPSHLPSQLLDFAVKTADPSTGRLFDEVTRFGVVTKLSSRTWLHTELLKAWIAEAQAGRSGARENAERVQDLLARNYLMNAPRGCWIDQLDRDGKMISDHIPASTFYHLFVAAVEFDKLLTG
ncbi:MAG: AGE family epimerase/isomerase [Beijerinckiaceae bacterium]